MRRNKGSRNIGLNVAEVKVEEIAPVSINMSKGPSPTEPLHVTDYRISVTSSPLNTARKSATRNMSAFNPRRNIRSIVKRSRRSKRKN